MTTISRHAAIKKSIAILITLLCSIQISAQIQLTGPLLDSLICIDQDTPSQVTSPRVLNVFAFISKKNSLYFSGTIISSREDITDDMNLYINASDLHFLLLKNIQIDSALQKKLIPYRDERFNLALDSIKFRKHSITRDGVTLERLNLRVYEIKKKILHKNTFVIRSRNYIPYLSAPEMFIPLKKVSDGYMSTEIAHSYYEGYGKLRKLNQKYYEDLKSGKKIILRMKKR